MNEKSPNTEKRPDSSGNEKWNRLWKSPLIYLLLFAVILLAVSLLSGDVGSVSREIPYSEFLTMLDKGDVEAVTMTGNTLTITPKSTVKTTGGPVYYTTKVITNSSLVEKMSSAGIEFTYKEENNSPSVLALLVSYILPLIMMGLMIYWVFSMLRAAKKGGEGGGGGGFGAFGFGKSSAKQYDAQKCDKRFHDVAGQDEAKRSLMEIVDILKNPTRYTSVGAEIPRGALLVGPPGTGKTLLAKAVAGEAGCPFFFVSGSAFVEMFVGTGAARVRDLFKQASAKAPCIVFIDEIDAIGKKRDGSGLGGNDEREQTLNQLLAEMDGFDPSKGIMVLAATNRPEILDKALLRPGRFDRRIPVELPDMNGRREILEVHARNKRFERSIDLKKVADATPGASGADLANILNEAALHAVRNGRTAISQSDLEAATEYVIAGEEKKSMVVSPEEKRIIAYHEIGHALVAAKQKNVVPIRKITIIPRTNGALGFTMQADEEEHYLMKKEELIEKLQVLTAGRAAEEMMFGTCTSGASNDIERATSIARSMITRFGMNETVGLMTLDTVTNPYLDGDLRTNCSAETAALVEHEMHELIQGAYSEAMRILRDNAATLNRLAQYLLIHENITGEEFMDLLREEEAQQKAVEAESAVTDEGNGSTEE